MTSISERERDGERKRGEMEVRGEGASKIKKMMLHFQENTPQQIKEGKLVRRREGGGKPALRNRTGDELEILTSIN